MGKFEQNSVSFEDFKEAFDALCITYNWWNDVVYVFRYDNTVKYDFNKRLFKRLLEDYYLGQNTPEYTQEEIAQRNKDIFEFGINVYSYYKEYLNSLIVGDGHYYDYTPLHLFVEHKQIMGKTIGYLERTEIIPSSNGLYDEYQTAVVKKFELYMKFFIKADITRNSKWLMKIIDNIDDTILQECLILRKIHELL